MASKAKAPQPPPPLAAVQEPPPPPPPPPAHEDPPPARLRSATTAPRSARLASERGQPQSLSLSPETAQLYLPRTVALAPKQARALARGMGQDRLRLNKMAVDEDGFAIIFVYGTLKKGFNNHGLLERAMQQGNVTYMGTAMTKKRFPLVCGPFQVPFLLHLPARGTHVHGEVYRANKAALKQLDELEGVDRGHYFRCPLVLTNVQYSASHAPAQSSGEQVNGVMADGSSEGDEELLAEAYFAGMQYTPGLSNADYIDAYTTNETDTYVPRKHRPPGRTFVEHVKEWIASSDFSNWYK
eukprot:SM000061S19195  [mRNA]  locus=s61:36346:37872:+ [translate_table: standard]